MGGTPPYTKDQMRQALADVERYGSIRKAAEALGKPWSSFRGLVYAARTRLNNEDPAKLARQGLAPDYDLVHEVPPGLTLKGTSLRYDANGNIQQYWNKTCQEGRKPEDAVILPDPKKIAKVSTLYDQEGRVTQQWVSERPEDATREALWKECAKAFADSLPRAPVVAAPDCVSTALMAAYPIGDLHLGMYAWAEEAGDDYDLAIAEKLLLGAIGNLVQSIPPCEKAVIASMGDFQHYDSQVPETPEHKNTLDADSRFAKMVRVSIHCIRHAINIALSRHQEVRVILESGNHDPYSTAFLTESLVAIYENEPRVVVDASPRPFHYVEFGANLIGTHHGDGVKMADLPLIMATDRPEAWGRTKYRTWWTGHIHKDAVVDINGVRVESFRVLPPTDAWAYGRGYRSQRSLTAIAYHERYGETARYTVNPAMLEAA